MLRDKDLAKINAALAKASKNRKLAAIYDGGDKYLLYTTNTSGGLNTDPYYIYNKKTGVVTHSSLTPFIEFIKMANEAKKHLLWET